MAQLAIKGHKSRGNEVIEILEMLGGKNKVGLFAKNETLVYFIKNGVINNTCINPQTLPFKTFTLEEFLEKYPYKVGDKVRFSDSNTPFTISRIWWDNNASELICTLEEQDIDVSSVDLQPYKEETMEETLEQITLDIPYGYEFFGINDDNQVVLAKIQPQYPKTYVECAKTLNCFGAVNIDGYKGELLDKLQELIICRDAYWKIAGDWKPDYMYCDLYCIGYDGNVITWKMQGGCRLLAFPTKEMRDAFYENFKELIELVKELL